MTWAGAVLAVVPKDVPRQRVRGGWEPCCAVSLPVRVLRDVPAEPSVDWRSGWVPVQRLVVGWVAVGQPYGAQPAFVPAADEQWSAGEPPVSAVLSSGELRPVGQQAWQAPRGVPEASEPWPGWERLALRRASQRRAVAVLASPELLQGCRQLSSPTGWLCQEQAWPALKPLWIHRHS